MTITSDTLAVIKTVCAPEDIKVIRKKGLAVTHMLEQLSAGGSVSICMRYVQIDDRQGSEVRQVSISLDKDERLKEDERKDFINQFVHGARQRLDLVIDRYMTPEQIERRVLNVAHGAGALCAPWAARQFCTSGRGRGIIPEPLTEETLPTHTIVYKGAT